MCYKRGEREEGGVYSLLVGIKRHPKAMLGEGTVAQFWHHRLGHLHDHGLYT